MLRARKHRKVSMTKVSKQEPEAEFCQHPSASRVANQVSCEPKYPLQKSPAEASGVVMPKSRLSREEKGKMPICSSNTANRKVTTAIIPSPNSRAATPCAGLVLMSEATVPRRTRRVHDSEARGKVLPKANRLRSSIAGKAPQRASLSSSSGAKLALCGEARTEALFSANPLCGDKRSRTSSYARSKSASGLDGLGPTGSDLREFLTNKRKSESFRTTPCCQLLTTGSSSERF